MLWGMPTEKIRGLVSLASNSPGAPTGYGVQAEFLVRYMKRHGMNVGVLSNYGLEGAIGEHRTDHGSVPVYPRGVAPYSQDVLTPWHEHHRATAPDLKHAIMTLYDVWVYEGWKDEVPVISWVPLDHVTLPPKVAGFLRRENVTPVAMAPHGVRQLEGAGIESVYIPHAVNTGVFQKTPKFPSPVGMVPTREVLGVGDDTFLVMMVAANKANGIVHRKAYDVNFLAFSAHLRANPDSHLYVHADPSPNVGGFDLALLAKVCGIPSEKITFANRDKYRIGYSQAELAALYSAADVLLAPSYGEGFGVPVIEAQACGTRVIGSGWAASADLVAEDGWLVEGQPFFDAPQIAFYQVPLLDSVVSALALADKERGFSAVSRKFALEFDDEKVWSDYWMPFLKGYFE
jgi:glycosyltransferase involved in cell wall biosynthesis